MVRAATEGDLAVWSAGRRRSFLARAVRGAWWTLRSAAAVVTEGDGGFGDAHGESHAHTSTGRGSFPAEVLAGTLDGGPEERLLVEGSSVAELRTVVLPGSVSFPTDGLLWQPERAADRGILIPTSSIREVVTGLPGQGVLLHLDDGRFGFRVRKRDLEAVVEQLGSLVEAPRLDEGA